MDRVKSCYACGICGSGYLRSENDMNRLCKSCDKKGLAVSHYKLRREKMVERFLKFHEKLKVIIESEKRYYNQGWNSQPLYYQ